MGAGDDILWEDIALLLDPPVVRLVQQAAQSIPDATATGLTFGAGSTVEDSHGFHSETTNNTRITPNIEGLYDFGGAYFTAGMTTPASRYCAIRINGSTILAPGPRDAGLASITSSAAPTMVTDIYMNGSTDYAEIVAFQDSSGAVNTVVSSQFASVFWCKYSRPDTA